MARKKLSNADAGTVNRTTAERHGDGLPSDEQLLLRARYLPAEFRTDWDPIWGHPHDLFEKEEMMFDLDAET